MTQHIRESIEVQAPLHEVFHYWSNFQNFPRIMRNVEEVHATGPDTSHWKVKGPLGYTVEYDARTTEANPTRGIAWQSVEGEVENSGLVRFEEVGADRTRIDVTMSYADPPGGKAGEVVAEAISNPERELREDLENFARRVEQGELRLSLSGDAGQEQQGGNLEASTLQYYLRGIDSFPAEKEEVASTAESNGAPQNIVAQIRNADTERFNSPEEVMQVLQQG